MAAIENTDGMNDDKKHSAKHIRIFDLVRALNKNDCTASLINAKQEYMGFGPYDSPINNVIWEIHGIKNQHEFELVVTHNVRAENIVNIMISSAGCRVSANSIEPDKALETFDQYFKKLETKIEDDKISNDFDDIKFKDWPEEILSSFSSNEGIENIYNVNIYFHSTKDESSVTDVSYTMKHLKKYCVFMVTPELVIETSSGGTKKACLGYKVSLSWSFHDRLCTHDYLESHLEYNREITDERDFNAKTVPEIVNNVISILERHKPLKSQLQLIERRIDVILCE